MLQLLVVLLENERMIVTLRLTPSRCRCCGIKNLTGPKVNITGIEQLSRIFQTALPHFVKHGEEHGVAGDAARQRVIELEERGDADRLLDQFLAVRE